MISKSTVIDQIEITRSGRIQVRFQIRVTEDDMDISSPKYHRSAVEQGGDVDGMLTAVEDDITARPELRAAPIERDHMVDILKAVTKLGKVDARS
jgi:hypothetical protein